MTELHLHLDGSLSATTVRKILAEEGRSLNEVSKGKLSDNCTLKELESLLKYDNANGSLEDYLKCFELPVSVLQTPNSIRFAAMKLCEELFNEGITSVEIRFAPQLHTALGYTQEEILIAAIEASDYASLLGVEVDYILCMMRGGTDEANEETLELAIKYFGRGVVALDLAGDEASYPVMQYEELFKYAQKNNLPYTIHAGEADGPESIENALKLGAWRIGHGIAAINDIGLIDYMAKHEIPVEICPTSNVQTKAVSDISSHPVCSFLEKGMLVTLNTDNRTVSDTSMKKEFELIKSIPGYLPEYERRLVWNAENSMFRKLIRKK